MIYKSLLQEQFQNFCVNRQLTYDILAQLSEGDLLQKWSRPGLDSFSKHFQEVASVQNAFSEAMITGEMDFSKVPGVFEFQNSGDKTALREALNIADKKLGNIIKDCNVKSIKWDDIEVTPVTHLVNLTSHEVFHQGQMAMAIYSLDLLMPKSWLFNWAMPGTTNQMETV